MLPASNYTQIPNVILDRLNELQYCEARVIFLVCRQTIGFHQKDFEMSLTYIQEKTGLARASVNKALKMLLEKGWLTRNKTQAGYKYAINIDRATGSKNEPVQNLASSKNEPELVQKMNSEDELVVQKMNHTLNKYDLKKEFKEKDPPTPQGGNGAIAFETSDLESAGNQQTPLSGQQAKKSGSKSKGGSSRATKNQTSEQILAMLPEAMQARFRKFWKGYSRFCTERNAKTGPIKRAVVAWKFLVDGDFNGKGLSGFDEGVRVFLKQQGDRTAGIPHASKFLFSTINGSGAWEDALEQAASQGSLSDLTGGVSDRGSSPRIVTAADFEFSGASPPPAHIKAQIAQMRGMTVA